MEGNPISMGINSVESVSENPNARDIHEEFLQANVLLTFEGVRHLPQPSDLPSIAIKDLERLILHGKGVYEILQHLEDDHRIKTKAYGNNILRMYGLPMHETSLIKELELASVKVPRNCCDRYVEELGYDLANLTWHGGNGEDVDKDRVILIRTMKYFEQLGLCSRKWREVAEYWVPNYDRVTVDVARDSREQPITNFFDAYNAMLAKGIPVLMEPQRERWYEYLKKTHRDDLIAKYGLMPSGSKNTA